MEFRVMHLFQLLLIEAIALCLIASYRLTSKEATFILLIFTFLFASLIFQLSGSTTKKLTLLAAGNFVGLFWNQVFSYFALVGSASFGKPFETFSMLIYPFLNLMWVVPFCSVSLGFLPKTRDAAVEAEF